MPRKAANSSGELPTEPRRSSRIKVQPKEELPPPKKTKPRTKKADKESTDKEEKPKSRGKKRKAEEEPNGDADDAAAPTEKKVRFFF
jgi:hypothetical protein